ncbi:protein dachsous-like [Rhagoletis pomonella]|uniref:protein dachsous-like n=1 Tax=Rhagoletis pomonella TaxID=28610 RepID=UPI001785BA6D|nr:protein dachsous-like [Rhagoletis pomonella]
MIEVSASDPDCGVNAIVNYTLGNGIKQLADFEVRSAAGEICITSELDYEKRSSYEFPVIAIDRVNRNGVRYSIYSGDPESYFSIDTITGNIRIANHLDHETRAQILLNIQAMSGDPPAYGHTQRLLVVGLYVHIRDQQRAAFLPRFY